jgi:hypothetical protein
LKYSKKPHNHHLPLANARAVIAAVAIGVEVAKAVNALIVVRVRKETDHKAEIAGIPAPVKQGIGPPVHRVIAPRVRKDRAASAPRANRVRRVKVLRVQRVLKLNMRHVRRPSSLPLHNLYREIRQSKLQ